MTHKEREEDNKRIQEYINTPGKLPMHAFRKKLSFDISNGMGGIDIDNLCNPNWNYMIDWDVYLPSKGMNLQRGFVWSISQKRELILSILKGITIAPITVIQYRDDISNRLERKTILKVIDGKQRLSTLISFYKGEFPILFEGKEYFYIDLTLQAQRELVGCFRYNIAYEYPDKLIPDDEKIAWFDMINFAGTPQDIEHIDNLKSK